MTVHDDMDFYLTPDKFVIEPHGKGERLSIDRKTGGIQLEVIPIRSARYLVSDRSERRICGLLGTIQLPAQRYLLVATHRIYVGQLNGGQPIWQLAGYDLLPYTSPPPSAAAGGVSHAERDDDNAACLAMLRQVLDTPFHYFSYTYDLTHSLQRLQQAIAARPDLLDATGLAQRAEPRFAWNGVMLAQWQRDADRPELLQRYALPLLHGFVSIHALAVNGAQFTWALISRRSVQRAGTRLNRRGIDEHGHCANFVETEQLVEYAGDRVAFVQTRGSIPLFWTQAPNLRYKPPPTLDAGRDHAAAAGRHVADQLRLYGRQVMVNLVDHRGAELKLEQGFAQCVAQLGVQSSVRYESFDFHAECRKMRWDRLNILIDRLAHEQDEFGVFQVRRDGTQLLRQEGVFRTNCVDCLDRTNVVQSMLAKRSLEQTLLRLGVLRPGHTVDGTAVLIGLFKNVWADNADLVSTQYSGTGALKTDFTRTGKRTVQGALWDGWNSAVRYVKNNFRDGRRQDAIDLFLGNYAVPANGEMTGVLQRNRGWKYNTLPSLLLFASLMFVSSAVLPEEYNTENLLFMMFWGAVVGCTIRGIFSYGTEFVNAPRLLVTEVKPRPNDA